MSTITVLLDLNRKDGLLATLRARRARIEAEFNEKLSEARERERSMRRAASSHAELEAKVRREEQVLAAEGQRLIERRKALSSFSNYKVAQSAEKEIEVASKELRLREEGLLKGMGDLETALSAKLAAEVAFRDFKEALEALASAGRDAIAAIDTEIALVERDRALTLAQLEEETRREYEKVVKRYPSDPVSEVEGGICGGCRMSVGPQAILSVRRGAITRCPGCGRILHVAS